MPTRVTQMVCPSSPFIGVPFVATVVWMGVHPSFAGTKLKSVLIVEGTILLACLLMLMEIKRKKMFGYDKQSKNAFASPAIKNSLTIFRNLVNTT